jgi:oxygen-dependent protoporphyrinogen oxidase
MNPVVIIGGGISGLSTAYYLSKAGVASTIVEPRDYLGGVIRTEHVDGCVLEQGPDSFISIKPAAVELIKEVGLGDDIIGSNDHSRKTYLKKNGRLIVMPDGLMMMVPTKIVPVALSPLLGIGTKLRMGMEWFRKPAGAMPDRSVAEFVADHYGQEAVDYLAEPLLSGIYGGDPRQLSAPAVLAQMVALETKYGSLTKGVIASRRAATGPLFRTLKSGLGALTAKLETSIQPHTKVIRATAESIERTAEGFRVRAAAQWIAAENIVLCCQAYNAAALLTGIDSRLAELLNATGYNSSMTIAFGFDAAGFHNPIPGHGFLIPKVERKRLAAGTWVATKFSHRAPDNRVVLRCFVGGDAMNGSDDEIVAEVLAELRDLIGLTAKPIFTRVARWHRSMAQYTVGHNKRLEEIRARLAQMPGLHVTGNAYEGIGIPDCIRMGKQAANAIVPKL